MIHWSLFALVSALAASVRDMLSKHHTKNIDPLVVSWALSIFSIPFLVIPLLYFGVPQVEESFWPLLFLTALLLTYGWTLYVKALSASELSLTIPMIGLTPIFTLLFAYIALGEEPSVVGILGVALIVFGTFILSSQRDLAGVFKPFLVLKTEQGPQLMLLTAFVFSVVAILEKACILRSSPYFLALCVNIVVALLMTLVVIFRSKSHWTVLFKLWKTLLPFGICTAVIFTFQYTAVERGPVAYVIAIKRTSILMSVIAGSLFFKEGGFKERVLGTCIMLIGVIVLVSL